ncbi:MAG: hypothetical protein H0T47_17135 [Planctomycetaceae bacterium]|nr:hypothetical protein [Planctomycetaceae bacterium]
MADKLVELGRSTDAVRLIRTRIKKNDVGVWPLREWLERFAEDAGDWTTVTELTWDAYREFPSADGYRSLREAAERAGRWKDLRPMALRIAERSGRLDLYLRILLDDGAIDLAIARLRNAPSKSLDPDVRRDVALAAATNDPESGIALLWENVELLILRRDRNAYRSACDDLVQLRELYRKLYRKAEWQQALTSLLEDNTRLRALRAELKVAGP